MWLGPLSLPPSVMDPARALFNDSSLPYSYLLLSAFLSVAHGCVECALFDSRARAQGDTPTDDLRRNNARSCLRFARDDVLMHTKSALVSEMARRLERVITVTLSGLDLLAATKPSDVWCRNPRCRRGPVHLRNGPLRAVFENVNDAVDDAYRCVGFLKMPEEETVWISSKDAARRSGLDASTIRKRAQKEGWATERPGKRMLFYPLVRLRRAWPDRKFTESKAESSRNDEGRSGT